MIRQKQSPMMKIILFLAVLLCLCGISFYTGYYSSISTLIIDNVDVKSNILLTPQDKLRGCHDYVQRTRRVDTEVNRRVMNQTTKIQNSEPTRKQNHPNKDPSFIQAMARVSKHGLMSKFDNYGVATLESPQTDEALLIYNHYDAIPSILPQDDYIPRIENVTEAIQNCDTLNVQFTHTPRSFHPQCHVWIPVHNLPAFHVDRWMRLSDSISDNTNKFDHTIPLRHIGAITTPTGVDRFELPKFNPLISAHWKELLQFFENADRVLKDIKKLLEANGIKPPNVKLMNGTYPNDAITVMTVNYGQSNLLTNFICAAKSRGLGLRRVLVFVTDEETKQLVESFSDEDDLGVMVYYDKYNFATMPKGGEDVRYGECLCLMEPPWNKCHETSCQQYSLSLHSLM